MLTKKIVGSIAALAAVLGVGSLAVLSTGTQGCTACDCAASGGSVQVSEQQAPLVAGVAVAGECGGSVACGNSTTPCTNFWITPTHEGTCRLTVSFDNGAPDFTRDIEFRQGTGCCHGFYLVGDFLPVVIPASAGDAGAMDGAGGTDASADGG